MSIRPSSANRFGLPNWAQMALLALAAMIPLTLLWDYSWESTIGIDTLWSPPHVANDVAVLAAGILALWILAHPQANTEAGVIRLGKVAAPHGIWIVLWGVVAFGTAYLFDMWWQGSYGIAAGIWHPPQCLKATAYFAILVGTWSVMEGFASAAAGGIVLTMIGVATLASNFPNRQHSATFFQISCAAYPVVFAALAMRGRARFPAATGALVYTALMAAAVWVLPFIRAEPMVGPIFHDRHSLLPPPFPLALVLPALALDWLMKTFPGAMERRVGWSAAVEFGLAFALVFGAAQWLFAGFLLSPVAEGRLFAGGGREWPFFLQIQPGMETAFWTFEEGPLKVGGCLLALALAVAAARCGLSLGSWMRRGTP